MDVRDDAHSRRVQDLGDLTCTHVPMEFRRTMQSVELGDVIEFRMRDPSAKEDLPPLARMMGHRVLVEQELDDGTLSVVVERAK
jgi:TusA-related sulfurtransferase